MDIYDQRLVLMYKLSLSMCDTIEIMADMAIKAGFEVEWHKKAKAKNDNDRIFYNKHIAQLKNKKDA